jgi:solute carrier family 34 (sodium-dependent phosphate cotransporter)
MDDRHEPEITHPERSAIPERSLVQRVAAGLWYLAKLTFALFVFVGALQLMKTGASNLEVLNSGGILVRNAGATLGLGWIGALFVLSGSPMAATALTLVAADSITEIEGFTMLTGSRLGAAFVVLVVAVVYALRGGEGERFKPVSTAIMALSTTAIIYIPAAFLGYSILQNPTFHAMNLQFPHQFADLIDLVYGGLLDRVETLPAWLVFLGGLGVLLISFKLIDLVVPDLNEETLGERRLKWLTQKWPMFALGSLVALITMSVSVALTVLVPLVAKKYVKREDIIPYVLGANITTLGDTMLAAFALHSGAAVRIVLAEVLATSLLSVIVLAFFYPQLRRLIFKFQRQMLKSKTRLAAFTAGLFLVPLALIFGSNLFA